MTHLARAGKLPEVSRKTWITIGAVLIAAIGGYLVHDALTVSDEERLEQLVLDSTGRIGQDRMDAGRRRWVDLRRQPFEVSALGESHHYGEGDDDALEERARQAVRTLARTELRALSSGVEVEGERARVTLRVLGQGQGLGRIEWSLRKHGDDWLAERLSVQR